MVNLVSATLFTIKYVEEGIPTIPLLKGSDPREMETHSQWLNRLGFKRVGLHATEYILNYDEEPARELYGKALEEMIRMRMQPLVIGVMGPKSFPPLLYRGYPESSFAGMSWLLKAKEFVAYHGMENLDLKNCVMKCDCEACLGKSPNQVSRSVEDIAEHNLVQFKNFVERRGKNEINTFDAILEEGTMAVVGDLHIGTPQSLWQLCLSKLREIKPSYIVLLGDTFDLVNGKPSLWEVAGFFRGLRQMEVEVIPILGCADSSQKSLFEAVQGLSLSKKPLRLQLLKPNLIRALAIKNLLAFYAVAKEKVRVKLAEGKVIVFEHGHGLGFNKTDSLEEIAKVLLDEKYPEEIYVIGHYHRSFFDPERGIAILGSWQTRTREDRESGFIPEVMNMLLIKEDGSMKLIRGT
ncbi:MAG: metallophosphoesterase [Candidatus Brockarchaeota archaeon]|nr:metallophosphoesterase [Candidatus Brockarchaeota archaeon]